MERKKRGPVGRGVSVGRSVEEIIVTRALNDVPDTPVNSLPRIPHVSRSHNASGGRGSKSSKQLRLAVSRSSDNFKATQQSGFFPQVEEWGDEAGKETFVCVFVIVTFIGC